MADLAKAFGAEVVYYSVSGPEYSGLLKVKDNTKLVMTPHVGWASVESRQQAVHEVEYNIEAYLKCEDRNVVR